MRRLYLSFLSNIVIYLVWTCVWTLCFNLDVWTLCFNLDVWTFSFNLDVWAPWLNSAAIIIYDVKMVQYYYMDIF
jgi:hypothetical protein